MTELDKILIIGTLEIAERKILDHMDYSDISPVALMDIQKIFEDLRRSILEGKEIK